MATCMYGLIMWSADSGLCDRAYFYPYYCRLQPRYICVCYNYGQHDHSHRWRHIAYVNALYNLLYSIVFEGLEPFFPHWQKLPRNPAVATWIENAGTKGSLHQLPSWAEVGYDFWWFLSSFYCVNLEFYFLYLFKSFIDLFCVSISPPVLTWSWNCYSSISSSDFNIEFVFCSRIVCFFILFFCIDTLCYINTFGFIKYSLEPCFTWLKL